MKSFSREFDANPKALEESRRFLAQMLDEIGWSSREIDLQLAIGEVMQNIVRHGFGDGMEGGGMDDDSRDGKITMTFKFNGDSLVCEIADNAPPANPDEWTNSADAKKPEEGGYGLLIIRAIADDYQISADKKGNRSTLVFNAISPDELSPDELLPDDGDVLPEGLLTDELIPHEVPKVALQRDDDRES